MTQLIVVVICFKKRGRVFYVLNTALSAIIGNTSVPVLNVQYVLQDI